MSTRSRTAQTVIIPLRAGHLLSPGQTRLQLTGKYRVFTLDALDIRRYIWRVGLVLILAFIYIYDHRVETLAVAVTRGR